MVSESSRKLAPRKSRRYALDVRVQVLDGREGRRCEAAEAAETFAERG